MGGAADLVGREAESPGWRGIPLFGVQGTCENVCVTLWSGAG